MTGVDILATQEVAIDFVFNWTAFWITFGAVAFIGLLYGVIYTAYDGCSWTFIPISVMIFAVFGGMFGCLMGTRLERPVAYETRYKVTISDDVSMTDFLEKYEIVSTEGKIYTVREVKGGN